jgi:hypothetical protein
MRSRTFGVTADAAPSRWDPTTPREAPRNNPPTYRRPVRRLVGAPIAFAALVLVLAELVWRLDLWSVLAGGLAVGVLTLAFILRDGPVELAARLGLDGDDENRTEAIVKALTHEGWKVPALELDGVDGGVHVLLSPSGVAYIVESKSVAGRASLDHGVLIERFGDDPMAVYRHDLQPRSDLASQVAAEWSRRMKTLAPAMRTIVVVWGDFLDTPAEHDAVLYVAGTDLIGVLRRLEMKPVPTTRARWA